MSKLQDEWPHTPTACFLFEVDMAEAGWHYSSHLSHCKHHLHKSYMSRLRGQEVWKCKVPTNADNIPTALNVGRDPLEWERNQPYLWTRWLSGRMGSSKWEGKTDPKSLKIKWKHILGLGRYWILRAKKVVEEKLMMFHLVEINNCINKRQIFYSSLYRLSITT